MICEKCGDEFAPDLDMPTLCDPCQEKAFVAGWADMVKGFTPPKPACSVCGGDVWTGSSAGTCSDCLQVILANSFPEEADEPEEPEDEDLVTSDYITFYRANMGRIACIVPHIDGFGTCDPNWQKHVKAYMDRQQFWPNVWLERERGGYDLLTLEET